MKTLALGMTAILFTASLAWSAPWVILTSTSIKDGARIPVRFGGDDQKRACSPPQSRHLPLPGQECLAAADLA